METNIDKTKLREILTTHFNTSELRSLAFDLDIPWEDLDRTTRTNTAISLIEHSERHSLLPNLVALVKKQRPQAPWPQPFPAEAIPASEIPPSVTTSAKSRNSPKPAFPSASQPKQAATSSSIYQQTWFQVSIGIILIGIVTGMMMLRTKQLANSSEILQCSEETYNVYYAAGSYRSESRNLLQNEPLEVVQLEQATQLLKNAIVTFKEVEEQARMTDCGLEAIYDLGSISLFDVPRLLDELYQLDRADLVKELPDIVPSGNQDDEVKQAHQLGLEHYEDLLSIGSGAIEKAQEWMGDNDLQFYRIYYNTAIAYQRDGQYQEAINYFAQVITITTSDNDKIEGACQNIKSIVEKENDLSVSDEVKARCDLGS